MGNLLFKEETFAIRGAVFEVYRAMGCGFRCLSRAQRGQGHIARTQSTGDQLPEGNKLEIRITDQLRQSPQSTN